jgi:hypothetical protein
MSVTNGPLPGFSTSKVHSPAPRGRCLSASRPGSVGSRPGANPKPVKLGPNTTVWREQDIRALCERVAASHIGRAA